MDLIFWVYSGRKFFFFHISNRFSGTCRLLPYLTSDMAPQVTTRYYLTWPFRNDPSAGFTSGLTFGLTWTLYSACHARLDQLDEVRRDMKLK